MAREAAIMEKRQGYIDRRSERIASARSKRTKFREELRAKQDQRIAGRRERIKSKYIKGDAENINIEVKENKIENKIETKKFNYKNILYVL